MFSQLMWKEFHNLKGVLLLGFFLLLAPYGFAVLNSFDEESVLVAAMLSLVASQMTVLVLGACAIGVERQNRSMDFLLGLPVAKVKVLLSKATLCLLVCATIWSVFAFATEVLIHSELRETYRSVGFSSAAVGFVLFAVAWLGSIALRGLAVPITLSLVVAVGVVLAVNYYASQQDWAIEVYDKNFRSILLTLYLGIGAIAFVAGCVMFMRR